MSTAHMRAWVMTTSPRNPAQVRPELTLLAKLDGKDWYEKDEEGHNLNQRRFSEWLVESGVYQGNIPRNVELAARDRLRAPQMLGFAYIDGEGTLHITPAGWQLIEGEQVNSLFLRQLVKWQFPSWQHGGNPRTRWRYQETFVEPGVHPFVETIRATMSLDGVTEFELAIFLLPCASPSHFDKAIERIAVFRERLSKLPGGTPRDEFREDVYRQELARVYAADVKEGRVDIRESVAEPGSELERFLETKKRNLRDYADAAMRYFRYSGIFSREGSRLVVRDEQRGRRIVEELDLVLRDDYDEVDSFYAYLGDAGVPEFPWEQPSELAVRWKELELELAELAGILDRPFPKVPRVALHERCGWAEERIRGMRLELMGLQLTPEEVDRAFDEILDREVSSPATYMEWNTWRALLHLNSYCSLNPNFSVDLNWLPIYHAGGRQPDIEVVYCGEYAVAVEVTLREGDTQYHTETEPVTRHVERFQEKVDMPTFGLFIAPSLHKGALDWYHYHAKRRGIYVVPLDLQQFRDLVSAWSTGFKPQTLLGLLKEGVRACLEEDDPIDWQERMGEIVSAACEGAC